MMKKILLMLVMLALLATPASAQILLQKSNFASTYLTSDIPSTATTGSTFTVNDGSYFPSSGVHKITITTCTSLPCSAVEIMTVSTSGNTMTIQSRENESTTKQETWFAGTTTFVTLDETAGMEQEQDTAINSIITQIATGVTPLAHEHAGEDVTSGKLAEAQMPDCDQSEILLWGADGDPVCTTQLPQVRVYDVDPIHISFPADGDTPPAALTTLSTGSSPAKTVRVRDFSENDDVIFSWYVPYGIDTSVSPKFQVEGWIKTAPDNNDTIVFTLACASIAHSELLSSTLGSGVSVTLTADANLAQYDRFITGYSTAVTITGLAGGEEVICQLKRSTGTAYTSDVAVEVIKIKYAKLLAGS